MSELAAELTNLIEDLAKSFGTRQDTDLPALWSQLSELGLVGIGLDEALGGSGGDLGDLIVVIRELARVGLNTPIVESSTAAYVLGGANRKDSVDTVVVAELDSSTNLGYVPFADPRSRVVIVGPHGVRVADLSAPGAQVDVVTDIAGLPVGDVRLAGVTTERCPAARDAVLERLALARAASLLGCALGAYELTRAFAREREQFGAPLVEIPAVSVALAQLTVRLEQARAAVDHAVALCADTEVTALRRLAAVTTARVICATTATAVARGAHQLHGAIGVTLEYPLHRYSTALWAWRDADLPELSWSERLGEAARIHDEDVLWEQLTV